MNKNIIITGSSGVGKSAIIAAYRADNWTATKLLDGVELVENPQTPLTEEGISELKYCHVLILDNIFPIVRYRPHILSLEIVQDIIQYRYIFRKTMVIVECDTVIMEKLNMAVMNKILKDSDHIHLATIDDKEAALSRLRSILDKERR